MAVTSNTLKTGMCISHKGKMWIVVEFQHVKPGKGAAFVRTKLKEVQTGRVLEETFRAGERIEDVRMETKRLQYLYDDGDTYYFMDERSYEQVELAADFIGDAAVWMKENDTAQVMVADGNMIGVEPPMFVELEVTKTEPGVKGDTAQGGNKPATLETGATVQVPLFIEVGDTLKIDTRDGSYITRV
jgi:elongation factor P